MIIVLIAINESGRKGGRSGEWTTASVPRMDEIAVTEVARALLREQAPHLADLPLAPSPANGSSNVVLRLGEQLAVRLPRTDAYAADLTNELTWLPHLAGSLTAPVPEIVHAGEPSTAFDRPWSVVTWIPGEPPVDLDRETQATFASELGTFLASLHSLDLGDLPSGSAHWGYRCGEPVSDQIDAWLEEAATGLADLLDPVAVRRAWALLREVPDAIEPPCWVHTDVSAENVLVHPDGRLAGVIDFGGLGVGDRSIDLLYAWSMLDAPARRTLRETSGADEATWLRARAWAFVGPGLLTISDYRATMPARTARLLRLVEAVAGEVGVLLR